MLTVIGYGVTRNDLTTFQIKIVFFSTISKFLQTQIEGSLAKYPTMVPTLISSEIGFLIVVMLVTLAYLYQNFKLIYFSLRSMDTPIFVHCKNQVIYRRNVLVACYIIVLIYAAAQVTITATWCSMLFKDGGGGDSLRQMLTTASVGFQAFVLCALALVLSGVLDRLLNTTGDHLAIGTEILDQNVLNQEFVEIMMAEIDAMRESIVDRSRVVTYYNLYLTEEQLSEANEPLDKELKEMESVHDGDRNDPNQVYPQSKQEFAIVGPDLTDLESGLKHIDLRVATIQSDKTPSKSAAERHAEHLKSLQ